MEESKQQEISARRDRIARRHAESPYITYQELAEELDVTPKTIQRDVEWLRKNNRWLDPKKPTRENSRAAAKVETALDTYATTARLIEDMEAMLADLKAEVGFKSDQCECCGRKNLSSNPLTWANVIKLFEAIEKYLRLAAQISGQLESTVIVSQQADRDVETIIALALEYGLTGLARQFAEAVVLMDQRRQQRMLTTVQGMFVEAAGVREVTDEDDE